MENINDIEILLVEDNPSDSELAIRALKKNNLANHIELVEDGEQALDFIFARGKYSKRAGNAKPKVIFLDLKLPKVDGLEVLREIKSHEESKYIPVVVLTSSKEERDIMESYKLGVNSYIIKPVDFEKFIDAVKGMGLYWLLLNQPPNI